MQSDGGVSVVCGEQSESGSKGVSVNSDGVVARADLDGLGVFFDGFFPVVEACLSLKLDIVVLDLFSVGVCELGRGDGSALGS